MALSGASRAVRDKAGAALLRRTADSLTDSSLHAAGIGEAARRGILGETEAAKRLDKFSEALPHADQATAAEGRARVAREREAAELDLHDRMERAGITQEAVILKGTAHYRVRSGENVSDHATPQAAREAVQAHLEAAGLGTPGAAETSQGSIASGADAHSYAGHALLSGIQESVTTRPPANTALLDRGAARDFIRRGNSRLAESRERIKDFYGAESVDQPGAHGIEVQPAHNGQLRLVTGEHFLQRLWDESRGNVTLANERLALYLDEEVTHAATLSVFRADWEAAGKPAQFHDWTQDRSNEVLKDVVTAARSLDAAGLKEASANLHAAYEAYFGQRPGVTPDTILDHLSTAQAVGKIAGGASRFLLETVRQAVQMRRYQRTTETVFVRAVNRLTDFGKAIVARLRSFAASVAGRPGDPAGDRLGPQLAELVRRTEAALENGGEPFTPAGNPRWAAGFRAPDPAQGPVSGNPGQLAKQAINAIIRHEENASTSPNPENDSGRLRGDLQQALANVLRRSNPFYPERSDFGSITDRGGEHLIYRPRNSQDVFKETLPDQRRYGFTLELDAGKISLRDALPSEYLGRLGLMNVLFGRRITVEGIFKNPYGNPQIATRQRWVDGDPPSPQVLADWLDAQGFHQVEHKYLEGDVMKSGSLWYRPSDGVLLGDAVPRNFIQTPDGKIVPVDVLLTLIPREALGKDALIGEVAGPGSHAPAAPAPNTPGKTP